MKRNLMNNRRFRAIVIHKRGITTQTPAERHQGANTAPPQPRAALAPESAVHPSASVACSAGAPADSLPAHALRACSPSDNFKNPRRVRSAFPMTDNQVRRGRKPPPRPPLCPPPRAAEPPAVVGLAPAARFTRSLASRPPNAEWRG
jgi:hypothetical protein